MTFDVGRLAHLRPRDLAFLGVWMVVFVVALVLQAIPLLFFVMIFALAVGVPTGLAMTVVPTGFMAIVCLSCVMASKLTQRPPERSAVARPRPRAGSVPRSPLADRAVSPAERYRDMRQN